MQLILNSGVNYAQSHYLKNKIKISNQVALLMACVGICYAIFSIIFYPTLTKYPVLCIIFSFGAIALNYIGLHIISRFLLSTLVLLLAYLYHGFLVQPGEGMISSMYVIEFSLTIVPWVLIDYREKNLLVISLAACYILICSQYWANQMLVMELDSSLFRSGFLSISSYAFGGVIAISCLLFMQNKNYSAEKDNEKMLEDIKEKNDELENQQAELQKNMQEISIARKQEEKHNWVARGIAEISDILRRDDDEKVYNNLLIGILKYIKANQGGIYLIKEDESQEQYLELTACYAFEREKFQQKRIEIGQSLVGQCYLEKEPIILNKVPEEYVSITSGLGDSPPTFITIIPIKQEDDITGVMEFALFHELESFEIEFLIKLGESIASFVAANTLNIKTKYLLEQAQQQSEKLRAQEEEMRQNMEELQATQEEMKRKEKEYVDRIEELVKMHDESETV